MSGIRLETRRQRADRTAAWRATNAKDATIEKDLTYDSDDCGLLMLRVSIDFADIMSGFVDVSHANRSSERFMDPLYKTTHWR